MCTSVTYLRAIPSSRWAWLTPRPHLSYDINWQATLTVTEDWDYLFLFVDNDSRQTSYRNKRHRHPVNINYRLFSNVRWHLRSRIALDNPFLSCKLNADCFITIQPSLVGELSVELGFYDNNRFPFHPTTLLLVIRPCNREWCDSCRLTRYAHDVLIYLSEFLVRRGVVVHGRLKCDPKLLHVLLVTSQVFT